MPVPLFLGALPLASSGETSPQRAQARNLPYRAIARGTAPEPIVPAPVRDELRSDGFEVSAFAPRKFINELAGRNGP